MKNIVGTDLDTVNPAAVPPGESVAQTRAYAMECIDQMKTGIWERIPGHWWRQIVGQEFYCFLQDRCTSTSDDDEITRIEVGNVLLLSKNSLSAWDVQETVRKSHVITHHQPTRRDSVTRSVHGAPRHP